MGLPPSPEEVVAGGGHRLGTLLSAGERGVPMCQERFTVGALHLDRETGLQPNLQEGRELG